jgi:hypothetical protein
MGNISGSERDDMRDARSDFSAAPRMLTNSVSGAVIVGIEQIECRRVEKYRRG